MNNFSYEIFTMEQHYKIFLALLAVLGNAAGDFSDGSDERYSRWLSITVDCKNKLWSRENRIYALHLIHLEVGQCDA